MPSKTSKQQNTQFPWKAESDYSELELENWAKSFVPFLKPEDRICLEGPMGVGKTTLTRFLLQALGVHQPPEGSPTFPIAHEYQSPHGEIVHIDFYRIRSEDEIDEAGIPSYYWERKVIVISEWLSSWPSFQRHVFQSGRVWELNLTFSDSPEHSVSQRKLEVRLANPSS